MDNDSFKDDDDDDEYIGFELTKEQKQLIEEITDRFEHPSEITTNRKRKNTIRDESEDIEPVSKRHIPLELDVIVHNYPTLPTPESICDDDNTEESKENVYIQKLKKIRLKKAKEQQDAFKKKHDERNARRERAKTKKNEYLEIYKAKQESVVLMKKRKLQDFFECFDEESNGDLIEELDNVEMTIQAEQDIEKFANELFDEEEWKTTEMTQNAVDDGDDDEEEVQDEDNGDDDDDDDDDYDGDDHEGFSDDDDDEEQGEGEGDGDDADDDDGDDDVGDDDDGDDVDGDDDDDDDVNEENCDADQVGGGKDTGGKVTSVGNGSDADIDSGFQLSEKRTINRPKFGVKETTYEVSLTPNWHGRSWLSLLTNLHDVFAKAIALSAAGLQSDDRGRIYINQEGLDSPIVIHFRELKDITPEVILAEIIKVLQSKQHLVLENSFTIHIGTVRMLRGGHFTGNLERDIKRKHSIFEIKNEDDNLCCARAIWVCHEYAKIDDENDQNPKRKSVSKKRIRDITSKRLKCEAIKLHNEAGVRLEASCGIPEIKQFERHLDVQIIVLSGSRFGEVEYRGSHQKTRKLFLLRMDSHFHAVVNVQGFYGNKYFCMECLKAHGQRWHKCTIAKCRTCSRQECKTDQDSAICSDCNVVCKNSECFQLHKKAPFNKYNKCVGKSFCETFWKCPLCTRLFQRKDVSPDSHSCEDRKCVNCQQIHTGDHQCFIEKRNVNPPGYNYIFFDFECIQETGFHIPNLCVAQKTCKVCIDRPINGDNQHCDGCGIRQMTFTDAETFCDWVFSPSHSKYTIVAHNMKGYDGYFLLAYLYKNAIKPEIIFSGGKIMYMYIPSLKIRVIDSLNFIQSSLAKLPKTFGEVELKKGYFPHLFNTEQNQNYVGKLPDVSYYGVDSMNCKNRKQFLCWYKEKSNENYVFDFQEELFTYCLADVDILRRCLLKFRQLLLNLTNTDPLQYITAASVCMAVYNSQFLKDQTLARLPSDGLTVKDQFSRISIAWLEWVMKSDTSIHIQHACNGGEQKVGKYRVDGLDKENKTVYEYHSCFYHGCPDCYSPKNHNPKTNTSFEKLYVDTQNKKQYIEAAGFTYLCKWDHEFRQEIKSDSILATFVDNIEVVERLHPRDAFFGGRTNAYRLHYKPVQGETVQYVDFTSLYPYVNKYCKYPIGYPEIITSNFQDISSYFGLIQCKILPPRQLYHPVLPYRSNGKLMFPLCRTCTEDSYQGTCTHSDKERALLGTWCSVELDVALQKGYVVQEIHEVYHFHQTACYDSTTGTDGLFTNYINTFLKIKQEASGWPTWCKTDTDKDEYIRQYEEREDILLDRDNIKQNDGLRALAKLMLNSFWGRYGMRLNLPQTEVITDQADFHFLLSDETKHIKDFHCVSDDYIVMEWLYKDPFVPEGHNTNIFVACFTTAHARLRLYNEMDKLSDRVLYSDTDSLIYVHKDGQYNPSLGDYLGDLTSELTCKELGCKDLECLNHHYITEFISGGPKNYAYTTDVGTEKFEIHCNIPKKY
ncbi:uncharacterized protein [Argopecten irradians]|uniref:uncharacterized protein n=1 Tax=Argopecten irradians TaxID=31199 RepID=UPI00371D7850